MDSAMVEAIRGEFQSASRYLLLSHIRPDGDAVGSLLGIGLSLIESGKAVQMVLGDGIPPIYRHLPGSDLVEFRPSGEFDLVVVLDCSDLERLGELLPVDRETKGRKRKPDINIDHHITNIHFARYNLVEPKAVATAEILTQLIHKLSLPLTKDIASNLLTGILADTIGFRTANMNAQALITAARLVESGADLPELYQRVLLQRPFEALRYWGAGLSKLTREGPLIWTSLTLQDRLSSGYPGRDDADLINLLSAVNGAQIAVIFTEQKGGRVKVSWRAQPGVDVAQIAMHFGGGGHTAAAGVELNGTLSDVQNRVLAATRELFLVNQAT